MLIKGGKFAFLSKISIACILLAGVTFFSKDLFSKPEDYFGKTIVRIDFKGNRVNSAGDLLSRISARPGAIFTQEILNEDLKALFSKRDLRDATLDVSNQGDGVALVFTVVEFPVVDDIEFIGMEDLNEQEVSEAISLKPDEVFTLRKLAESEQYIIMKYRDSGHYRAAVRSRTSENSKTGKVDVKFLVDPGEDITIARINLLGVRNLNEEDILNRLEHQEDGLISDGTFKEYLFDKDKNTILQVYRENGFTNAVLRNARWDIRWEDDEREDRVIIITYEIDEGEKFYFSGYRVEWNDQFLNPTTNKPLFSEEELYGYFENSEGSIGDAFDQSKFSRDRGMISYLYSQQGYIFSRVQPKQTIITLNKQSLDEKENSPEQKAAKIDGKPLYPVRKLREILKNRPELLDKKFIFTEFIIAENDIGRIEDIIVKGNKKTKDYVIRREVLVNEDEIFNSALVQRSRERIYNLGFFKEVDVDARPGTKEGMMNLIFTVKEQPTGNISLGGGYGTQTGFSIFTEVSENNFQGTGQRLSGKVEFGPLRTSLETSWTEPYLGGAPWSLTLSGFYSSNTVLAPAVDIASEEEQATYKRVVVGTSVGIGHRFWVNWGHYHRFSPVLSKASDPTSMVDDSIYQLVNQGWQVKNTLTNGIYYDNRDNVFNTTQGLRAELSADLVGSILGGADHYLRVEQSIQYYWWAFDFTFFNLIRKNILRRWRAVFEHRANFTYTHQLAPVYNEQIKADNPYIEVEDRLYLGGYESLRGWNLFDASFPDAWRDGGSHRVLFGTEFRIPVEPSLFWLVWFFDAGALYEEKEQYNIDSSTSQTFIDNLEKSKLTQQNFALDYFRYSWGFGFRLQIPILPLRLYLSKRLIFDRNTNWFRNHPLQSGFDFVFGIGDRRF